jgi:diadenosine tetraphosphatase ApaH/serine/threonine PP2A family protein phosphatase
MRYVVLTDIHGNLEALDACLADATARGFDRTLVLGDVVGYGADPGAAIARIRELAPAALVRGDHDKVACGLESSDGFNAVARTAVAWTRSQLTDGERDWLRTLSKGPVVVDDLVEICHGAPFDEDAYIFDELDAHRALRSATRPLCLFGHTHQPVAFVLADGALSASIPEPSDSSRLSIDPEARYLVNPGAVGQPRDGDPRAAYAIVDVEARAVHLYRLEYDVASAQRKILNAGLPEVLATRLAAGR